MLVLSPTASLCRHRALARQATLAALLNSYLRETSDRDPRDSVRALDVAPLAGGESISIRLARSDITLRGTIVRFSTLGQHRYGDTFYRRGTQNQIVYLDIADIAQCLLEELSLRATGHIDAVAVGDMSEKIHSSFARMVAYIERFHEDFPDRPPSGLDFTSAEQSLLLGHPFHPCPKSLTDTGPHAFTEFSPEKRACFQLRYMAVHRDILEEDWLGAPDTGIAQAVRDSARRKLGSTCDAYAVVPVHPWQARYLLRQPELQSLMAKARIVDLGAMGPLAYPTSSVRSVWMPATGYAYKLSLRMRITNLVRENTREQARRTIDAARVIHAFKDRMLDPPDAVHFNVILETGYQTLRHDLPDVRADIAQGFTTIYRPMALGPRQAFVMASLLEAYPGQDAPKLIAAIHDSSGGSAIDCHDWFDAYLRLSMLALLKVLARTGISFEAHLQNAQITLRHGWPVIFHVRDLEGVSVDRSRVDNSNEWANIGLAADSPLLYSPEQAWQRTQYYFFVNHLGGLVHALASYLDCDERPFWRRAREILLRERATAGPRLLGYLDALLDDDFWPAKANLTSCFQQRGETPLFVNVINPIKAAI